MMDLKPFKTILNIRIGVVSRVCLALILVAITCLAVSNNQALAAKESLTVSPTKSTFELIKGQQASGFIKIKNSGEQPINVELYTELFSVINLQYDYEFNKPDNKLSASNWVSFDQKEYRLEPKQQTVVNYHIKVPEQAEAGGYYVAVFAQTKSQNSQQDDIVEIKRVASLLYIENAGEITKSGNIESFKTTFWHKDAPLDADIILKNSGNTHYRVDGYLKLKNIFGSELKSSRVQGLLMPNTSRLFEAAVQKPTWPGLYKLETQITFPASTKNISAKWIVFYPPVYIVATIVLLAVFVIAMIWLVKKIRHKH